MSEAQKKANLKYQRTSKHYKEYKKKYDRERYLRNKKDKNKKKILKITKYNDNSSF